MSLSLSEFDGSNFYKGAGIVKMTAWFFVNVFFVKCSMNPLMGFKVFLLKCFGANIGQGLIIKPGVNVKFPWKLEIGDDVWLGENVWIDNLDHVTIGNNVCISQGAMLLTGNHDYTQSSFPYRNAPIVLEDGVWIGAKSVVSPGVTCHSHSILAVASVATKNLEKYTIYQGNPAKEIRKRIIN